MPPLRTFLSLYFRPGARPRRESSFAIGHPRDFCFASSSIKSAAAGPRRDMYAVGDDKLLTSRRDRISVLDDLSPARGSDRADRNSTAEGPHPASNHSTGVQPRRRGSRTKPASAGRASRGRRLKPILVGSGCPWRLIGSGWKGLPVGHRRQSAAFNRSPACNRPASCPTHLHARRQGREFGHE